MNRVYKVQQKSIDTYIGYPSKVATIIDLFYNQRRNMSLQSDC